jgi:hypothetical protein
MEKEAQGEFQSTRTIGPQDPGATGLKPSGGATGLEVQATEDEDYLDKEQ